MHRAAVDGAMNVLELFCASGGMAEGLRRAGILVTMAFDKSSDACASYEKNLGHRPVEIDVRDLLRLATEGLLTTGTVDLLIADPPCTPWSRAGKRQGTDDERDMLEETVAIVSLLKPTYFLIANVPGLDDSPNWPTVQKTIGGLSSLGWCIDFARLDAADYGVPQHRIRPFWFGHPKILTPCIRWPERTHCDPKERRTLTIGEPLGRPLVPPLQPWVTCRQALGHLPLEDLGKPIRIRWRGQNGKQAGSIPDRPARVVGTSSLSDGNVLTSPGLASARKHAPSRRPRASHADEPAGVVTVTNNGNGVILFDGPNHRPSKPDAPARSLTGNTHSDGALIGYDLKWHDDGSFLSVPPMTASAASNGNGSSPVDTLAKALDEAIAQGTVVVPHHPPSDLDEPSRTIRAGTTGTPDKILAMRVRGDGTCREHEIDAPAHTIRATRSSTERILLANDKHPINQADAPSYVVTTKGDGRGAQGACVVGWPWDRPATTITADERIAPQGHHGGSFPSGPNAVKLSEKAAAILQGFPESWVFVGKTKAARWSLLGQAMPPGLAEAVGLSIKKAMGGVQ
jgi:site-specific DNA-cytosine methylase